MIGCTRCGRWHKDAEAVEGRRLSCSEVGLFWSKIKQEHNRLYGHYPGIATNDSKEWICIICGRKFFS